MVDLCDLTASISVPTDAHGTLQAEVRTEPVIAFGMVRREAVCPEDGCTIGAGLAAAAAAGETLSATSDELAWPATAVVPASPVLTIESLQLDDGTNTGTARVRGEGFAPASPVALSQCPGDEDRRTIDTEDCIYDYGVTLTADEAGSFTVEMPVYPRFQRSSGEEISCVETPHACLLAAPWPEEPNRRFSLVSLAQPDE